MDLSRKTRKRVSVSNEAPRETVPPFLCKCGRVCVCVCAHMYVCMYVSVGRGGGRGDIAG